MPCVRTTVILSFYGIAPRRTPYRFSVICGWSITFLDGKCEEETVWKLAQKTRFGGYIFSQPSFCTGSRSRHNSYMFYSFINFSFFSFLSFYSLLLGIDPIFHFLWTYPNLASLSCYWQPCKTLIRTKCSYSDSFLLTWVFHILFLCSYGLSNKSSQEPKS